MEFMHTVRWRALVAISLAFGTLSTADALVRDSVTIDIRGQQRIIRLVSDDAGVEYDDVSGANPTGCTLEGYYRLELVRLDGSMCGKLDLGMMAIDHGDGWDRKKVLIKDDYNGDGHFWEVAFPGFDRVYFGHGRAIAGYDSETGRLVRYRIDGSDADTVFVSVYPRALYFSDGYLRARSYTNAEFDGGLFGYITALYRYDRPGRNFVFVKFVQDVAPDPWPEWPSM